MLFECVLHCHAYSYVLGNISITNMNERCNIHFFADVMFVYNPRKSFSIPFSNYIEGNGVP